MHHEIQPKWRHAWQGLRDTYISVFPIKVFRHFKRLRILGAFHPSTYKLIRIRFLCAHANYEVIRDLFLMDNFEVYPGADYISFGVSHAGWIAGLVQDTRWLNDIKDRVLDRGMKDEEILLLPSLLLFDDPGVGEVLVQAIEKRGVEETLPWDYGYKGEYFVSIALECLRFYDEQYGTSLAEPYKDLNWHRRVKEILDSFLAWSEAIRGGVPPGPGFRGELWKMIQETAVPLHYLEGLLFPLNLPRFETPVVPPEIAAVELKKHVERMRTEFRQSGRVTKSKEYLALVGKVEEPKPAPSFYGSRPLCKAVLAFVDATDKTQPLKQIYKVLRTPPSLVDMFGALEIDLYHEMPVQVIARMFGYIHQEMGPNIWAYEQHALQLLMRGDVFDVKARHMWDEAQQLRANYEWIGKNVTPEPMFESYPMKKREE